MRIRNACMFVCMYITIYTSEIANPEHGNNSWGNKAT